MGATWIHLLLKGNRCNAEDEYLCKFTEKGLRSLTIPVLDFEFVSIKELASSIRAVSEELNKDHGIIITSPRVVEALSRALDLLEPTERASCLKNFNQELIFVVGEKSGKELEKRIAIKYNISSSQTGSGDALCRYIKECCTLRRGSRPIKLLYPKGSRSDGSTELALLEHESDIEIRTVVVYNTYPVPNLTENILRGLKKFNISDLSTGEIVINLIFFSPSGVSGFLHCDQQEFSTKLNLLAKDLKVTQRYSSIGRTTEAALLEADFPVFCVAEKPNPNSLVHAILHNDAN